MTMRALLLRGMLVGLVSAALALVFAWIFGEPQVSLAIAFKGQHAHEAAAAEPEIVSRIVQQTSGLAVAIGLFGVAIGRLFAVAFALAYGRIGGFGIRAASALVAGGGFVTVVLVPFLFYPANPPAVGVGDTIGARTGLYFAVIAISAAIDPYPCPCPASDTGILVPRVLTGIHRQRKEGSKAARRETRARSRPRRGSIGVQRLAARYPCAAAPRRAAAVPSPVGAPTGRVVAGG
ncbi:CbtA family protein [Streptosporangium sp. NBC_01755]|uniref:CbtA family protein n=1 Tax=Streptosporangium sp. NBC_01755 TaxID=2975949 RepID=UPI002DD91F1E|nr:CbtA family protein [Streptosporangium sp. NBC_01755]WSD01641.1 CbtA family protein [Streptosporangium sp. NBC_01755]